MSSRPLSSLSKQKITNSTLNQHFVSFLVFMRADQWPLTTRVGKKSFLYQRLTEEDCNKRNGVERQKEYVDGFFTHTKILSEASAPLEIVSRLLGMKLVISIIPNSLWTCFMQHLNEGISEVLRLSLIYLQSAILFYLDTSTDQNSESWSNCFLSWWRQWSLENLKEFVGG